MRLRLFAFVLPAALVTVALFATASSLVTALETRLNPSPSSTPAALHRIESRCDYLDRKIHALITRVSLCQPAPACAGSPLLCPVAADATIEREYHSLREALYEECQVPLGLMNAPWALRSGHALTWRDTLARTNGSAGVGTEGTAWSVRACEARDDRSGSDARVGAEPSTFVF